MIDRPVIDFPAPRLADQAEALPRADGERDAVDRADRPRAEMELRTKVLDFEDEVSVGHGFAHRYQSYAPICGETHP